MNIFRRNTHQKHGFTLIELLAVIAIVIILAAFLSPAVGKMRSSANAVRCAANLRQISVATQAYCAENNGAFPYLVDPGLVDPLWTGRLWPQTISFALSGEYGSNMNMNDMSWYWGSKDKNIFNCPEAARKLYEYNKANGFTVTSSYMPNSNIFVGAPLAQTRIAAVKYPAKTALMADTQVADMSKFEWVFYQISHLDPKSATCRMALFHGGGGNVLFVDGHVERITKATSLNSFIIDPFVNP